MIPNPWDIGSALYLQRLGFKALATTSSGAAWRHGMADGQMSVQQVLVHLREMVDATGLPVMLWCSLPQQSVQAIGSSIFSSRAVMPISCASLRIVSAGMPVISAAHSGVYCWICGTSLSKPKVHLSTNSLS